jgi:hypothetical protein
MLVHHGAEDYGAAAERAADWATQRLEQIVARGRESAINTIDIVRKMQPKDYVVPSPQIQFQRAEDEPNRVRMKLGGDSRLFGVHPYALEQVGERCDMPSPKRTMDWLVNGENGTEDLVQVLNHKYSNGGMREKKFLVRAVNDTEVRGFLSDRFRRLDSAPIVESFIDRTLNHGAVPLEGKALDTKFYLKVALPHVLEPIPGEVMLWGIILKNSDFGDGKLEVSGFAIRLRCTNLAMGEDSFSKVHLGGRLSENIEFSQRTYALDTETTVSAVKDIVDSVFEPSNVKKRMDIIKHLAEDNIDADAVLKGLNTKSRLTKAESEEIAKIFGSAEIEMLPQGQNAWRLSNAISLLAQKAEPTRQLELEEVAGEVAGLRKAA